MIATRAFPSTLFDHVLWTASLPDGNWRVSRIHLGECVLLFTSLDAFQDYLCRSAPPSGLESDGPETELKPLVFSRSRREFHRRARRALRAGCVGALFDPDPRNGEASFLKFSRIVR